MVYVKLNLQVVMELIIKAHLNMILHTKTIIYLLTK